METFNTTFAKIERLPLLIKELEKLSREKQQVERRLEERRDCKEKMKADIVRIQKMKEEEVILSLNQSSLDLNNKLFS
jgi:hypothetical protein